MHAEELQGRVIFATGTEIRIRLGGESAPAAGDRFDIFKRRMDNWEEPEICGSGVVTSIEGDLVLAQVEGRPSEAPARGQTVRIRCANPVPLDAEARKHDPLAGSAPTQDQAGPLLSALQREAVEGRFESFMQAFDMDAVQARALGTTKLSDPMRDVLAWLFDGLVENLVELAWSKCQSRPSGCRLVSILTGVNETRAVFRFLDGTEQSIPRYVEILLLRSAAGRVRIIDSRRLETADFVSVHLRVYFVPDEKGLKLLNQLKAPTAADLEVTKERDPLWSLMKCFNDKQYGEVLKRIDKNPKALNDSRVAHALRVVAASWSAADSCADFIAEADAAFPDDAALRYVAALALERIGKPDEALAAWDRLDATIRGDAFVDLIRARLHAGAARWDDAAKFALRATETEPTLIDAWQSRLGIEIRRKNFKGATRLLTTFRELGFNLEDMKGLPSTGDFFGSEEYKAWKEEQGPK